MTRRLFHINVTRQCQLACSHCYIDQDIRDDAEAMSVTKMQEIANVIGDTHADVHIIGGEPTLVDFETHKQYLAILSKLKNSKTMIVTALQNARAVKVAKLYQNIATSYDPNARTQINDDKWIARVNELIESGNKVHVCASLSKSVINYGIHKVLDELYDFGFRSIHLAAMVPTINALSETPDPTLTSEAMIASAKWVVKKRMTDSNIFVSPYDGLLQGMGNYDGLRCPAGDSCVNVEPNGQIHACVAKGGEVKDVVKGEIESTEVQLSSNAYVLEVARHNRSRAECLGCEFWATCKGGCRVLANTEIAKNSSECAGFKGFLNFVKDIDKGVDRYPVLSEYLSTGVTSFKLPKHFLDELRCMINKETWVTRNPVDVDDQIKSVPDWMYRGKYLTGQKNMDNFDCYLSQKKLQGNINKRHKYIKFFKKVFDDDKFSMNTPAHKTNFRITSVKIWNGQADMLWHYHISSLKDLDALIYLSDFDDFPIELGGGLESCTVDTVTPNKQVSLKNTYHNKTYHPDNGRVVLFSSGNRLNFHRTMPLKQNTDRIVLLVSIKNLKT